MSSGRHVAYTIKVGTTYKILVGKPEGKRPLRIARCVCVCVCVRETGKRFISHKRQSIRLYFVGDGN
jgi:hypothetical protein